LRKPVAPNISGDHLFGINRCYRTAADSTNQRLRNTARKAGEHLAAGIIRFLP
jgi:hypothetical protein